MPWDSGWNTNSTKKKNNTNVFTRFMWFPIIISWNNLHFCFHIRNIFISKNMLLKKYLIYFPSLNLALNVGTIYVHWANFALSKIKFIRYLPKTTLETWLKSTLNNKNNYFTRLCKPYKYALKLKFNPNITGSYIIVCIFWYYGF